MKGLERIPSLDELSQSYGVLQSTQKPLSVATLSLWSQWARFDPRLAEQIVGHCSRYWKEIPAVELRECLLRQPWPSAFGVILLLVAETIQERSERQLFQKWMALVMEGVPLAPGELFFIGTRSFAGKLMREDAFFSIKPYRKWGYLGREKLISKHVPSRTNRTLCPPEVRRKILDELLRERTRIRVRDYRKALADQVSPRVAETDLKNDPRLQAYGNTRGRFYQIKRRGK